MFKSGKADEIFEGGANKKLFSIWKINLLEGKMNCANCAIAVDRTFAGFPTSALPKSPFKIGKKSVYLNLPNPPLLLENEFGKKFIKDITINEIKILLKPEQRGIIFGYNKNSKVGHFFNVINENGVIKFLDGQTGKSAILKYDTYELLPTNF